MIDANAHVVESIEDSELDEQTLTVVIDTVGFIRALLNPRGIWGEIIFEYRDRYELIVAEQLLVELEDVLQRPQMVRKYSVLVGRDVQTVRQGLAAGRRITLGPIEEVSRDPNDDYLIAMAVLGQALFLVTEDKDLLSIGDHEGIRFITGKTFLDYLRSMQV